MPSYYAIILLLVLPSFIDTGIYIIASTITVGISIFATELC